MKRRILVIIILVPILLSAAWQREAIDWGMIGAMGLGGIVFRETEPFFEVPLIAGAGDREYREELISNRWVFVNMLGMTAAAGLLPNQDGWLNRRSYAHLKGALGAVTSGLLIKELTKDIVGRPRPDYQDRIRLGIGVDKGRESWPSGHAVHFTTTAAYLSLYTWDEWQSMEPWAIAAKSGITALLAAGAGYVAYSRVADNRHYPGDVIAGSILGAGTALLFYSYQQWWGNPDTTEDALAQTSFSPISVQLVSVRF